MKRILSLFIALVLILSTFASCELFPSETTKVEEANIEEAVKQLRDMYKDLNGTSIQNGKELVAQVKVGKTVFSVAWTSSDARITVEVVDGLAIVNIPNDIKENANYTLTASITSPEGQSAKYEINLVLSASFGMITSPEAGVAYKLGLLNGNEGPAVFYFDGSN